MKIQNAKKILSKKKPEKKLLFYIKSKAGRGAGGRITVRHRGGGAKRLYRIIDFGQKKIDQKAKVLSLEYDPYRSGFIALLEYEDKEKKYILAPQNVKVGDTLQFSDKAPISAGNRMRLKNIPLGIMVHNIEIEPHQGGKLIRSAGTAAKILAHEGNFTNLEMPSGEVRKVPQACFASIGMVSHPEKIYEKIPKAGRSRLRGRRPTVRGSAMIPPDHPHGGGEGKAPIGLKHPKTPWGKPALGVKTRRRHWTDKFILQRRKKK